MKNSLIVLLCFLTIALNGCGAIFNSAPKPVLISSEPEGADVYINGKRVGQTPYRLKLEKSKAVEITYKKLGYKEQTYTINTKVDALWIVLDIVSGLVPLIVDAATGRWTDLMENEVTVTLEK